MLRLPMNLAAPGMAAALLLPILLLGSSPAVKADDQGSRRWSAPPAARNPLRHLAFTSDIISMPDMIWAAARLVAVRPLPQNRSNVTPLARMS